MSGREADAAVAATDRQKRDEAVERRRAEEGAKLPDASPVVGGVLDKLSPQAALANPSEPVSRESHREGQIQQIDKVKGTLFEIVKAGLKGAERVIAKPEVPPHVDQGVLGHLLVAAGNIALVAAGAEIGFWVGGAIVAAKTFGAKFVENAIKESIKHAFTKGEETPPKSLTDLDVAFLAQLDAGLVDATKRYGAAWSARHDQLAALSDTDLAAAVEASAAVLEEKTGATIDAVTDRVLIGWTNFLAQMTHGAMAGWDFWTQGGSEDALALSDSTPEPRTREQDPTKANVAPKALDAMLAAGEAPDVDAQTGILEVFVDLTGRLLDDPAYQMRLKGVGPAARARLSSLGRMGDVPINKLVRVCDLSRGGIIVIAGISITADGYVRATNWSPFEKAVFPKDTPVGPQRLLEVHHCQSELIAGRSSAGCYRDHAAEAPDIQRIAEAAQNISLANLKV